MPASERIRYLPTTIELVPEVLLSQRLTEWRGLELRPLVRQRLAGLMRADVDSISLSDEGVLRVILSGDAVIAQLALLGEPQVNCGEALFIYCDLREAFELPDDIAQMLSDRPMHWEQPLGEPLLQWLLETLAEPAACVELGLVSEAASAVLEEFLEQQEILTRQSGAIEVLSALCETFAAAAARAPEADLTRRVIESLKSQPPRGMVDGEPSYWDEIYGFTDNLDEMPPRAVEDIRDLAGNLVASLPNDLRLALQLGELSVHDWITQKIEDDEVPRDSAQVDFDSEGLIEQVVERVLDQALDFDSAAHLLSIDEAEALCRAVVEGREDLWAPDLAKRLTAVGLSFPGMVLFEQAANAYSDYMVKEARKVLNLEQ